MKKQNKKQLEELVQSLAWNDGFGCYTRPGFEKTVWTRIATEAKWIIYFDIDDMHYLNEAFGSYDPVDAMLHKVLGVVRETDYVAGQWKSGDEFLVCITEDGSREVQTDPYAMVERLKDELNKQGMSATFAVVPVTSLQLSVNVKPAIDKVYAAKSHGQRGSVQK
jgi:GGDEF domain-containing protein